MFAVLSAVSETQSAPLADSCQRGLCQNNTGAPSVGYVGVTTARNCLSEWKSHSSHSSVQGHQVDLYNTPVVDTSASRPTVCHFLIHS